MGERTVKDFAAGDRIQHIFWGYYATVTIVGRKYIHVRDNGGATYTLLPTSVRKVV
jgi:hypothetical protein